MGSRLGSVLVGGVALVYFYPRREAQAALRRKVDVLIAERDALQRQRDMQVRKMDWIRKDVDYLEIAARDRLGLQKDGEYVIRFSDEAKASPE